MPHLIFRIPATLCITKPYQLTETIQIVPGQRLKQKIGGGGVWFCCSFLYAESDPTRSVDFLSIRYFVPSYENLKNFLTIWAFIEDGGAVIQAFETNEEGPMLGEIPNEEPFKWDNGATEWNPDEMRLRVGNVFSGTTFELRVLYQKFLEADQTLRDLIALLVFQSNRVLVDGRRRVYDNHLMESALAWIVIDDLSPAERCGGPARCPKCGGNATVSHVVRSFRERMETDLLRHFPDATEYAKVLDAYRYCRSSFFHEGKRESLPPTVGPLKETSTGLLGRETTLDELIDNFREEGLATQGAQVLLRQIAHCVLLNRLVPELMLWPRFELIKMVTNYKKV